MINPAILDASIDGPGTESYPERPTQEFIKIRTSKNWHLPNELGTATRCDRDMRLSSYECVTKAFTFPEPACKSCFPRFHLIEPRRLPNET